MRGAMIDKLTAMAELLVLIAASVLMLALDGCAGPQPQVHEYRDLKLTLVCADPASINRACRDNDGHSTSDSGQPIPRWQWQEAPLGDQDGLAHPADQPPINACLHGDELWMPWGRFCDLLAHELCHWNDAVAGRFGLKYQEQCERRFPG